MICIRKTKCTSEKGLFIENADKFHPTKFHGRNIREREFFPRHSGVQRRKIKKISILDIKTQYKPTVNFQCTHFNSCHPPGVKYGFIKGEAMRLLRTNSRQKEHLRREIQTTPEDMRLS